MEVDGTSIHFTPYRSLAFHCFDEAGPKAARIQSSSTCITRFSTGAIDEAAAAPQGDDYFKTEKI
ncbi:hypothetical protein VP1G_11143 [Cytospora mali]|uniref:Uncharacterized protein n=1 Tax=Cytospora mali TaxID=578113 RepID=A0A194V6Y8_CYTMA|nr:hypothetical protein VP1G_11143 [Valsa mali var. pyri (nom. inval.)]